ncbi:MAG TPA: type II toxin-antitoxin system VapC family toxin [Candidatus Binatia bacterium]|jgi:predicted nucleic acid-binding protein|nr:type II toxin-antitoxin system VapC family toxin [Candidatus Binatia bacterium]
MNSPSSPKDLTALPPGSRIFIDANVFIYHFTQTPLTAACTAFLQRVEAGDLYGITSIVILAEVAHRLMILEAIRTLGLSSRTAVKKLKETPDLVCRLSHYKLATERIPSFKVMIESVTFAHLQTAQGLSTLHGLLTNDSLTVAMMQAFGLTDLASNDPDLSVVPGLTIWRPQP